MDLDTLLNDFKAGRLTAAEAKKRILGETYADIGIARLDCHRPLRAGLPEAVYCESKTPEHVARIFAEMHDRDQPVLGTRARPEHLAAVQGALPGLDIRYDATSKLIALRTDAPEPLGKVMVICAGTSDLPAAEEAAQTAEFLGSDVVRHVDCGAAGLHRLIAVTPDLADANCVIAVAGMDGVLPTVVSGLSACPVIALPTSVGYGAGLGGIAALLTMLNSCAPGLAVVNIDNGFGAGYLAHVINQQAVRASASA